MSTPTDSTLVCLLRSPTGPNDSYEATLAAAGFRVLHLPVLSFTFVQHERLQAFLDQPSAFGGLVCSSPRAVEALARAEISVAPWAVKRTYAVGPATAAALSDLGLTPASPPAGTAEALAEQIIADPPSPLPLLFPCGNRRREVLPARLTAAGVAWQELIVYETDVRTDVQWPSDAADPAWFVSFSPSGIPALQALLRQKPNARVAAIGSTTAEAIQEAGCVVDRTAATPSPKGVLAALHQANAGAG